MTYLASVWSATEFGDAELSGYAANQLCRDTRTGIRVLAAFALLMQICVAGLLIARGNVGMQLYTTALFGVLSLHVFISAAYLDDVRTLQVLGMALLIIGALCLTSLAHNTGELHIGVMAATVILFVAIPLVPWALREALIIIGLTYAMLTTSLVVVPGRFAAESLWVLQLLIFGAGIIAIIIIARNTSIRKQDLRTRYELESAHDEMELLSMQDHLTGAWNRRYLSERFPEFAQRCLDKGEVMQVAILDIDDFKGINDEFGHQFGDRILISVADIFVRLLDGKGRLIRLGGDEFQIIYCGNDLGELIEIAVGKLQTEFAEANLATQRTITMSAGIVSSEKGQLADLEALYREADSALYREKNNRPDDPVNALAQTGTWKL